MHASVFTPTDSSQPPPSPALAPGLPPAALHQTLAAGEAPAQQAMVGHHWPPTVRLSDASAAAVAVVAMPVLRPATESGLRTPYDAYE